MLNFYERLDTLFALVDGVPFRSSFQWFLEGLLQFLAYNGYGPEVLYENDSPYPIICFSYKDRVVSISTSKESSKDNDSLFERNYCHVDGERFFYPMENIIEYIEKTYPAIQSKKDALDRELEAISAKHDAELEKELRQEYAKNPTSVRPFFVKRYSLDAPAGSILVKT